MTASPEKIRYRAEPSGALLIRPLDAMTLIYHRASGITHMVTEPVPEILEAMAGDALDAAELATRLSETFDLGGADDAAAIIADRLAELAELGLVSAVRG